eukprot:1183526-Prorocentrum_minimum.AAC.1
MQTPGAAVPGPQPELPAPLGTGPGGRPPLAFRKTRSPPHGVIRGSALCSEENSGPGIRLRNLFVERGGGKDLADCSTASLGMNNTRCWAAPRRRGYKRCVVALAGGPRFGVLERISWDLVVGCLRRDPKE